MSHGKCFQNLTFLKERWSLHLDLGIPKIILDVTANFEVGRGGVALFRWEVPYKRSEPSVHCRSKREASPSFLFNKLSRMQEDGSDILP